MGTSGQAEFQPYLGWTISYAFCIKYLNREKIRYIQCTEHLLMLDTAFRINPDLIKDFKPVLNF